MQKLAHFPLLSPLLMPRELPYTQCIVLCTNASNNLTMTDTNNCGEHDRGVTYTRLYLEVPSDCSILASPAEMSMRQTRQCGEGHTKPATGGRLQSSTSTVHEHPNKKAASHNGQRKRRPKREEAIYSASSVKEIATEKSCVPRHEKPVFCSGRQRRSDGRMDCCR